MAIKSFKHKGLKQLFIGGKTQSINTQHHNVLCSYMDIINASHHPKDLLATFGHKFKQKRGSGKGVYSLEINGNWRMTFQIEDDGAVFLDYLDYHGKTIKSN